MCLFLMKERVGMKLMCGVLLVWTLCLSGCYHTLGLDEKSTAPSPKETAAHHSTQVASVQLFSGSEALRVPAIPLNGTEKLTLAFDLMEHPGRVLSIYFEHLDRNGEKDALQPIEYLGRSREDLLLDYQMSAFTVLPYTHYTYRFPNEKIQFKVSGRYRLKVTAQGRPQEVLLSRTFWVFEPLVSWKVLLEAGLGEQIGVPMARPSLEANVSPVLKAASHELQTCLFLNRNAEALTCLGSPVLDMFPRLTYRPEWDQRLPFERDRRLLDLRSLDLKLPIVQIDVQKTPYQVWMTPDPQQGVHESLVRQPYGSFEIEAKEAQVRDPNLNGQYVDVMFALVTPHQKPLDKPIYWIGGGTDWQRKPENIMVWQETEKQYRLAVRLKQGLHQYRYTSDAPGFERINLWTRAWGRNVMGAIMFYRDAYLGTDRMVGYLEEVSLE